MCLQTILSILEIVILGITAGIVWRYTKETQKSNEIAERPILNMYLRKQKVGANDQYRLCLRNVGNGPAYNILISTVIASDYHYTPYLNEPNPILEKDGDEKELKMWVSKPSEDIKESFDATLGFQRFFDRALREPLKDAVEYEEHKKTAIIFRVTYDSIGDKKHYSLFRVYRKLVPIFSESMVGDVVVEFIKNGTGEISKEEAIRVCKSKSAMKYVTKNEEGN